MNNNIFILCRPNPDRWGTTQNNWELGTFPPTPMMPTIAPKYPSNPWDINNNRNMDYDLLVLSQ